MSTVTTVDSDAAAKAPKKKVRMEKTILGYVPTESIIYALHPTVRLSIYLLTGILPMFIQTPELTLLFLILALVMFPISNVSLSRIKMFAPMMVSVFIFLMLVNWLAPAYKEPGTVLCAPFGIPMYYHAIMWGVCIYLRMMSLIIASIFYFSTNRERDFLLSLRVWKVPFVVSYFIGLSMRSAGIFLEDYGIIREAERARGLDTKNLSFGGRIKHFAMYLVPLFTLSIRRSEEVSIALYAKGLEYKGTVDGKKRADWLLSKSKLTGKDKLLVVIIFAIFIVGMYFAFGTSYFTLINAPIYQKLLSTVLH